jgi:hypothetical protein
MKFQNKWLFALFLLPVTTLFFPACEDDAINDICTPTFNLDKFEENVIAELDGQVMGYAYIIAKNGTVVAADSDGKARNGVDGDVDMTLDHKMQVASISKSITTAATLAVLEDKGVDIYSSVEKYLPPHWNPGPGVENLSFYDLLRQAGGLNQVGTQSFSATRYDSLQMYIEDGAQQPKNRTYSNTHHGLMRVILPRLWDVPRPNDGQYDEEFCASVYRQCVQAVIFDKIDVTADLMPTDPSPLLAYSSPNDQNGGRGGSTDFTLVSGGTGWVLSTTETAKYWAYLWNTETFFKKELRDLMQAEEMGLWNTINSGEYGKYYCKLGGWHYGDDHWMRSAVIQYPDDVQLTIFINSPTSNGKGLTAIGRDAYDEAVGCF